MEKPVNLPVMRVTDMQLNAAIAEVRTRKPDRRVRGVEVRAALQSRFGARASTDRVYAAIRRHELGVHRGASTPPDPQSIRSDSKEPERGSLEHRLKELEADREHDRTVISRYANELDKARLELRTLSSAEHHKLLDANLKLHRQLSDRDDTILEQAHHIRQLEAIMREQGLGIPLMRRIERPRFK